MDRSAFLYHRQETPAGTHPTPPVCIRQAMKALRAAQQDALDELIATACFAAIYAPASVITMQGMVTILAPLVMLVSAIVALCRSSWRSQRIKILYNEVNALLDRTE